MEEVLRITAPGGVVCTLKDGKWNEVPSSRVPRRWTTGHSPSTVPTATWLPTDRVLKFPLGCRWFDGLCGNVRGGGGSASVRAWGCCQRTVLRSGDQ